MTKSILSIFTLLLISSALSGCVSDRKKHAHDGSIGNVSGVGTSSAYAADGSAYDNSGTTRGYGNYGSISSSDLADLPAGTQEQLIALVGDRVFFNFNSKSLSNDAKKTLDRQADWLNDNSSITVTIEGHADERGTREYNIALGEQRASTVKSYLVSKGVHGSRITVISYGKERPDFPDSNEAAWSKNRRAITIVN